MGIKAKVEYFMGKEGINANELASRMGVTSSTIYSMLQRDSSRIDIDLLIKISKALNVSTDTLLSYDPAEPVPDNSLSDLTPDEQAEVQKFADFVRSKRT